MSEPYSPGLISRLLRDMPSDRLATIQPRAFQKWPAVRIVPGKVIAELISNEQSRRR